MKKDMQRCGVTEEDVRDRVRWRLMIPKAIRKGSSRSEKQSPQDTMLLGNNPTIIQRKPQMSNDPKCQALGSSGREKLPFNRKETSSC